MIFSPRLFISVLFLGVIIIACAPAELVCEQDPTALEAGRGKIHKGSGSVYSKLQSNQNAIALR